MILKLILLGTALFIILFVLYNLLPRLKFKYKLLNKRKNKQKAFSNKIKKLEIK